MFLKRVSALNSCSSLPLNIINIVAGIIWLTGGAAVPGVQGPLTLLQCNLAGNARTLLTLLLFANSLHYSYPLNRIWFHTFPHTHKKISMSYTLYTWNGFTWIWLPCAKSCCYLWPPSVWAPCHFIRHCHYFYSPHFQSVVTESGSWSHSKSHQGNLWS